MTGPEGEGELPEPEDTLVRHVLDAIRGGESPDVVPETSSVVSFAEFLAVEAALDMRWPETAMEPSTDRIAALVTRSASRSAPTRWSTSPAPTARRPRPA
jgi:dihydrofolate synthase/folylpolyglutamate synthase